MEVVENQQTLADFLLLAQNVEKDLASEAVVQKEKKSLLKADQDLKSEIEERLSDDGGCDEVSMTFVEELPNFNEILPKTGEGKWMATVDAPSSKSKRKSARITYYEEGIFFSIRFEYIL